VRTNELLFKIAAIAGKKLSLAIGREGGPSPLGGGGARGRGIGSYPSGERDQGRGLRRSLPLQLRKTAREITEKTKRVNIMKVPL